MNHPKKQLTTQRDYYKVKRFYQKTLYGNQNLDKVMEFIKHIMMKY